MNIQSMGMEQMPHSASRPVAEHRSSTEQTGTSGVSDARRAELGRLEADASMQHEAADESGPQRPDGSPPAGPVQADSPAPQDQSSSVNPDIDKR